MKLFITKLEVCLISHVINYTRCGAGDKRHKLVSNGGFVCIWFVYERVALKVVDSV